MVNRAFQGKPVEANSIQRIARALDVEPWALYRTSDESISAIAESSKAPKTNGKVRRPNLAVSAILLTATIVLTIFLSSDRKMAEESPVAESSAPKPRSLQPSVVVRPGESVFESRLTAALSRTLNQRWRVMPDGLVDGRDEPQRLLADPAIDRVVEVSSARAGRFVDVQVSVHIEGSMRVVWRGGMRHLADDTYIENSMERAAELVSTGRADDVLSAQALSRYLTGRAHLDRVRTELNLRRALTDLDSAVRLAPQFADAHAALCEALVLDNVRTGNPGRLEEADQACSRALTLDPSNLEARRAEAYLNRKRGRLNDAVSAFRAIVNEAPSQTDAWLGLAETHLARAGGDENSAAQGAALKAVNRALALEPSFWKVPFVEARVYYYGGQLGAAIAASEKASSLDHNVITLSNLGSFRYCSGDFDGAASAYEAARKADSSSFIGEGQLGVVYYFRGDYDRAIESFEHALGLFQAEGEAQDHRLWGNYAHALRQAGSIEKASNAYGKAIGLAEATLSKGDGQTRDGIYLAYYYEMLFLIGSQPDRRIVLSELESLHEASDPVAQLYLAIIYGLRGDSKLSAEFLAAGSASCPGFAQAPDFQLLEGNSGVEHVQALEE